MLSEILVSQRAQFTSLAEAWLTIGATTFSVWEDSALLAQWPLDAKPHEAGLAAPILVGKKTLGRLQVTGFQDAPNQARLRAEADLIAQLVKQEDELDCLTAALIESQDQLLALYGLTQSTRSHLNVDQMLGLLLREVRRLVNAEGAFIVLQTNEGAMLVEQEPAAIVSETLLEDFFRRVRLAKQEILLYADDIPELPLTDSANLFLAPIAVEDEIPAILGLFLSQPAISLSPQLKLARAIADYAGAQIENALLHQKILEQTRLQTELDLAARIQLQLLPRTPPKLSGLELAAASKPALQVGGDFYDFIWQEGWPCTFVVGDVSGKGMSAAMLMAMTRAVIRSKANSLPTPRPEVVLGYSNEIMYDDFTEVAMFATVFIGRYDSSKRELLYANAGHSPVIYCPAGGPAAMLEADGTAMGVLPISLSEDQAIPLNPGDLIVVATDGFSEASNPQGEMMGYKRLLRLIETIAYKPANEIADILFAAVKEFSSGHPQDDDQTLVVVKGTAT